MTHYSSSSSRTPTVYYATAKLASPAMEEYIFVDESRYCISNADGRMRVWWMRGEHYADTCILERDSRGELNIIVWSRISLICKFGPVIFQNIDTCRGNGVTVTRYINQVLRPHGAIFCSHRNYIFQHDNVRALRDSVRATWFFLQYNIEGIPWHVLTVVRTQTLWNICVVEVIQRRHNEVQPRPTTAAEPGAFFL